MTTYTKPCPKPTRDTTDYEAKAVEIAGRIATIDGKCMVELCNHTRDGGWEIYPHHIIHRRHHHTVADPSNLFPCCVPCHGRIHANEEEFKGWLNDRNPGLYERLWQKAQKLSKMDWVEVYSDLLETYNYMLKSKGDADEGKA